METLFISGQNISGERSLSSFPAKTQPENTKKLKPNLRKIDSNASKHIFLI
jgi:hypothetical protein